MLKLKGKPKSVKLLGHTIKIDYTDTMDPGEYGESVGTKRMIKINTAMPEDAFQSTLFHELCHMAIYLTGWTETLRKLDGKDAEGAIEEGLVLALENSLSPIYKLK